MKEMTSKERLLAAMRREEVDRIPLSPRMANVVSRHYKSQSLLSPRTLGLRINTVEEALILSRTDRRAMSRCSLLQAGGASAGQTTVPCSSRIWEGMQA